MIRVCHSATHCMNMDLCQARLTGQSMHGYSWSYFGFYKLPVASKNQAWSGSGCSIRRCDANRRKHVVREIKLFYLRRLRRSFWILRQLWETSTFVIFFLNVTSSRALRGCYPVTEIRGQVGDSCCLIAETTGQVDNNSYYFCQRHFGIGY